MNYIELNIEFKALEPWRDILVSQLAEEGFESFVETKTGLLSYIAEKEFEESMLASLKNIEAIDQFTTKVIQDQNWNATWEENFDPVFVEDKLAIIAPFHKEEFSQSMVITIQPQMSFGTGHHQTTWLASKRFFDLDLSDKSVLDMGTGTGILAILAEKLGAKSVYAPDIDEWSYNNAQENIALNNCNKIELALGDDQLLTGRSFDVIVANINKNVLLQQFPTYAEVIVDGGTLLISGFFETDKEDLVQAAGKLGFIFEQIFTKDEWALVQFKMNKSN
ncbi:MAG: 50S ribosomal protein L11 methyltransferase [Crocinitomicaceae bacterium]